MIRIFLKKTTKEKTQPNANNINKKNKLINYTQIPDAAKVLFCTVN